MSTHLGNSIEELNVSDDGELFYLSWLLGRISYFEAHKGIIISNPG